MERTVEALKKLSLALLLSALALSASGCGWLMGDVDDKEVKELDESISKPDPRLSAYDDALGKFGKMLEAYNIKPVKVQSKLIGNNTADQSLPQDITKMLETALNKIGSQVVYIPFDPNYVISEATTGGNINRALPNIVITGGITEYDKDMIEKNREAKADAQIQKGDWGSNYNYDGGASYKSEGSVSRIALDLGLLNYSNQAAIAGVQTSNAITVRKSRLGWGVGAYFQGCGLSFDYSLQKKQGVYYALRLLVELSVIEVLGQYYDLPYWRCIPGSQPNKKMLAKITEEISDMNEADQLAYLKEYLFFNGYQVDRGVRGITSQDAQAIQAAKSKLGASSNAELFVKLWSEVPIDEARRRNKDFQKGVDAARVAQPPQQAQASAPRPAPVAQPSQPAPAVQPQQPVAQPAAPAPTRQPAAPARSGKEAPLTLGPSNEF